MARFPAIVSMSWPGKISGPWKITLRFADLEGRVRCVGLSIEPMQGKAPGPLTTALLRQLSLGRLMDHMDLSFWQAILPPRSRALRMLAPLRAATPQRGRPSQYPPDHLVRVARIYADAWNSPGKVAPTKAVADTLHISHSAAAKWVAKARDAGLLAPTEKGVAGGTAITKERRR